MTTTNQELAREPLRRGCDAPEVTLSGEGEITNAEVDTYLKEHENDPVNDASANRVEWLFRGKLASNALAEGGEWLDSYQKDVIQKGRRVEVDTKLLYSGTKILIEKLVRVIETLAINPDPAEVAQKNPTHQESVNTPDPVAPVDGSKVIQTPDAQCETWPLDSQVEDDERHKWEIHPHPFSSDYDYMVTNDDRIALDGILHAAEMYLWDSCEPGDTRKLVVVHNLRTLPLASTPDTKTDASSATRDVSEGGPAADPNSESVDAAYRRGLSDAAKLMGVEAEAWKKHFAAQDSRLAQGARDKYLAFAEGAAQIRALIEPKGGE